ncbi:hypothetical protein [Sphingorhabdus sp. Alg239-R122]|uniref:hypothetical protein n=1 Tax=Sphingorhabdus sp. Alg239-R122 TaxID=2305989 RepID=UPI0013D9E2DB|nr:hypothetical protein [Sphingorhabdus sp. Alg239-R122]
MKPAYILYMAITATVLTSCSSEPYKDAQKASTDNFQQQFMQNLRTLCGNAYAGQMVSEDPADTDMAEADMVMHVRECGDDNVRIPFYVGEDRSRTWVISKTKNGLRLKHDHRHEDGSKDAVTWYGGDTADNGSATRQEFPVDAESIALFRKEGLDQSVTNIWAVEVTDKLFAYELSRENRNFRVKFDITDPVTAPPPPWGSEAEN